MPPVPGGGQGMEGLAAEGSAVVEAEAEVAEVRRENGSCAG